MKIIGVLGNYFQPKRLGAPSPFGAYYLNKDYVDSFTKMNVLPVQVPYLVDCEQMLHFVDLIDGLMLTRGFDIPLSFMVKQKSKVLILSTIVKEHPLNCNFYP